MKNVFDYLKKDLLSKCKSLEYAIQNDLYYYADDQITAIKLLTPLVKELEIETPKVPEGWKEVEA